MITRLEINTTVHDTRAATRKQKIIELGYDVSHLVLVDVYTIDKKLSSAEQQKIARALANPLTQQASVIKPFVPNIFSFAVEIGYYPGVTDNIATTTKELISDLLHCSFTPDENVYTSQVMYLTGKVSQEDVEKIAMAFYNPLIQRASIKNAAIFKKENGMDIVVPRVKLQEKPRVDNVDLNVSDEELMIIGKQGIANADGTRRGPLALDITYMKAIRDYFTKQKRNPTDVELESIAQTWSEHCKHTIFADPIDEVKDGLYKTYIQKATEKIRKQKGKKDFCVSVFTDNSGAIRFDNKYLITDKVETHNSPSALDPFGGSITGIVGVNRDAIGFGLGAKPIINRYGFCFADPADTTPLYKGKNKTQKMLSPRTIMDGVISGVNAGGNCSGIPTPQGFVYFDKNYNGKPLVFVGTVGLIPTKINGKKSYVKKALPGDYIVMVGGRVGQDGIHGATFSSEALDTGSPATAVQIGDPITQKKLSDAIVKEARDMGLYTSITDNGAGGISCSVAEMAKESGGSFVKLDDVPLKYAGLTPWQIWISESQERMTLAVPKRKWKQFAALMEKRGVEATVIGTFTSSGRCVVEYQGKKVMDISMEFLHDGLPPRPMKTTYTPVTYEEPIITVPKNLTNTLMRMLQRLNITSFEFISSQYDHEVQAGSVLKPLQGRGRVNGDTSVTRPLLTSKKGVIISQSLYPRYSNIDTYHMAAASIDSAIRNIIVAGGNIDYIGLLDNFCWCSSTEPERLGQLKRAAKACYDYTVGFGTPLISGKDSMFNDFKGFDEKGNPIKVSIPPTLLVSSIGVINDVAKVVSLDAKMPGDLVYVLGDTNDEVGGSEYFAMLGEEKKGEAYLGNSVPQVDFKKNKKLYKALSTAMEKELIASAISITTGGLGIALAKTAIGGLLGMDVSLKNLEGNVTRDDYALFSESQGRVVVTIAPEHRKAFETIMKGNSFGKIGKITNTKHVIIRNKKQEQIVTMNLIKGLESYKKTFQQY